MPLISGGPYGIDSSAPAQRPATAFSYLWGSEHAVMVDMRALTRVVQTVASLA